MLHEVNENDALEVRSLVDQVYAVKNIDLRPVVMSDNGLPSTTEVLAVLAASMTITQMGVHGPDKPGLYWEAFEDDRFVGMFSSLKEAREWFLFRYGTQYEDEEEYPVLPSEAVLRDLAEDAKPTSDDDWGTERQINAINLFTESALTFIDPEEREILEGWALKATDEEIIAAFLKSALKAVGTN
jgi:hypothetical protein